MIKLSAGTAQVMGMEKLQTDAPPTTAYLMAGEGCENNCSFCAQAKGSQARADHLSRIIWKKFSRVEIVNNLVDAAGSDNFKRICIQAVANSATEELLAELLKELSSQVSLPICISKGINSLAQVEEVLAAGAERVNISLDVLDAGAYKRIKGGSYQQQKELLFAAAKKFPDRISTHLIIGLGESEEEVIKLLLELKKLEVQAALFAFTPIAGTELAQDSPPAIDKYRRIQIARYLIYESNFSESIFEFKEGKLVAINEADDYLLEILATGQAFETTGCPDCNRPYYNEKPGGVMYNYPRKLEAKQVKEAIEESKLVLSDE